MVHVKQFKSLAVCVSEDIIEVVFTHGIVGGGYVCRPPEEFALELHEAADWLNSLKSTHDNSQG